MTPLAQHTTGGNSLSAGPSYTASCRTMDGPRLNSGSINQEVMEGAGSESVGAGLIVISNREPRFLRA